MSVKSNQMRSVRLTSGIYSAPTIRFDKGNQIIQIRENILPSINDLEQAITDETNAASSQNSEVLQLFQDVDTLFNNTTILVTETKTGEAEAAALQITLNQIQALLSQVQSFTPYFNSIMPSQTIKGVGTTNLTLPTATQVYTFTPDANGENAKPTTFMVVGVNTTEETRFQVTWNMSFVGDIRQNNPNLFVESWANTSNGGIVYTTVTAGSKILYASQNGTIGQTYIPPIDAQDSGSFTGCCLLSFTDVITVPADTSTISFNFFISNHYSMTLSATIFSQIGFYMVDAFPLPTFLNATPALTLIKL